VIFPFRTGRWRAHDGAVILGRLALDLVMGAVVLSLLCIAGYVAGGVVVSLLTVVRARSRVRRRQVRLGGLDLRFSSTELAEIDAALDRIMACEALPEPSVKPRKLVP
jgi:hypothetical protein